VNPRNAEAGRAPWVAVAVLLVLALGLAIALRQSGVLRGSPFVSTNRRPGTPDAGDRVIEQALREAPRSADTSGPSLGDRHAVAVDSSALKHRWIDEVRGVDASALDARRREVFLRFANARECTCGCGYSLAACKASDMTCEVSGAALAALADSVRVGRLTSARGLRVRPRIGR
jgi:hypothetical protein